MTMKVIDIDLVSTNSLGVQGDLGSLNPTFSPDGFKVIFISGSTNLIADDTNFRGDVFVKDLITGVVTRVSTDSAGGQLNNLFFNSSTNSSGFSPDGTKVFFGGSVFGVVNGASRIIHNIYIKDLITGTLTEVSTDEFGVAANGNSYAAQFSPDGSKIAFSSDATNLVAGDTNGKYDIFIKDLVSGSVTRVSTDEFGNQANDSSNSTSVFSPDGSKIAFHSFASNFVVGDTNSKLDIFIKDLATGLVTRVSENHSGTESNNNSFSPVFLPDGTNIAFSSEASNLVVGDTNNKIDIFIKNILTGELTRISTDASGNEINGSSYGSTFSPDGEKVAFYSTSSNLISGDSNNAIDIFVKDLTTGEVICIGGNGDSVYPIFSPDSSRIVFTSVASNLVAGDTNNAGDIFIATLNTPPVAKDDAFTGNQDAIIMGNVLSDNGYGADSDIDGHPLTIISGTYATANGSVTVAKYGTFTYTPNAGFHGVDTFEYTVQDGQGGTDIGLVTFNIQPPQVAPVAKDDHFDGTEDTVLHGNVLADNGNGADSDANGDLLTVLPNDLITTRGGHVVLDADGHFTYTPKADYSGYDSFRYKLSDGLGGYSVAKVTFNIADVADNYIGTDGNDVFVGGYLNDTIKGGLGDDVLNGGSGWDDIKGGFGDDRLYGGAGWDRIEGNEGNDVLYGGKGSDWLKGGYGADLFILDGVTTRVDTIDDLRIHKGDALQIKDIIGFDPLHDVISDFVHIGQNGADSIVSVDADGTANGVNFTDVARIVGITGLDVDQLYADGDLIISNTVV